MSDVLSASSALMLALLGILVLRRGSVAIALGVALGAPLFFEFSSHGVFYSQSVLDAHAGATLPLSIFALALFGPELLAGVRQTWKRVRELGRVELLVVAFAGWATLAFAWGTVSGGGARPLIWVQVLVPLLAFLLGEGIATVKDMRGVLTGVVVACVATAVLLVVSSAVLASNPALFDSRLNDHVLGGLVIFQAWDYLPLLFVVAAFMAFGLCRPDASAAPRLSATVILAVCVMALYSRGAALTLFVGTVVLGIGLRGRFTRRTRYLAVLGFVVIGLAFAALGGSSVQRIANTLGFGTADVAASDDTRTRATTQAIDQIKAQPVVGQAMRASYLDPVTGVSKTINAHNQYLDYAVRAGLPLALLFVAILVSALLRLWSLPRWESEPLWLGAAVALTAVALVSNLFQVNFVQPLTALPLWFLVGLSGSRAFAEAHDAAVRPGAAAPTRYGETAITPPPLPLGGTR
jgi:O-antigen ligase